MKYSMKAITEGYTIEKKKKSSWWARIFSRPISFIFTYFFINIGLSPNMVSLLSILDVVIACLMIMAGGNLLLPGILLYLLWHILDCVDGNIARVKNLSSFTGEFFDALSGYTANCLIYLSVGVAAYKTTTYNDIADIFLVFGALASITDIFSRLIYQKYLVTEYSIGMIKDKSNVAESRKHGLYHVADLIMKNMSFASLFMPLLIIAYVSKHLDILIAIYFIYCLLVLLATMLIFIKRTIALDKKGRY